MWFGNPADPTAQPIRSGLGQTGWSETGTLVLPPAWRVEVPVKVSGSNDAELGPLGEGSGKAMNAFVTADPLGQRQLIRWLRRQPNETSWLPPNSPQQHIPTGGGFSLTFGSRHVLSVPFDVSRPDLESYVRLMASHAGIHGVTVTATRTEQNHLRILLQKEGEPGYQFPLLSVQHNVTCGGAWYPEHFGEFVMFRNLNYSAESSLPPDDVPPESLIYYAELAHSPFLWEPSSPIWYRSARQAGDRLTDLDQIHTKYWQFGYCIKIRHDPFTGVSIASDGWMLMLHVERQHHAGDMISGTGWPMSPVDESRLIANQTVRVGPKVYWPSPNEEMGGPLDHRTDFNELPDFLWITPDWG